MEKGVLGVLGEGVVVEIMSRVVSCSDEPLADLRNLQYT